MPELADADIMMGDRLIGEAPEYTLEQWLRCDALWPHLLSALSLPICRPRWMPFRPRPMSKHGISVLSHIHRINGECSADAAV
jgi:MarR-like DNA-binding transcriptional regulator SgrR of sgrS sRNA